MAVYDKLAAEYERGMARVTGIHALDIVSALGLQAGTSVLDLAAGTGAVTEPLAQMVGPDGLVVAADVARAMLGFARSRLTPSGLQLTLAAAENLPFADGSFAGAACGFGIQHMTDPNAVLRELRRVLRPGGRCAIAIWAAVGLDIKTPISEAFAALSDGQSLSPAQDTWATTDALAGRLRAAGFAEVEMRESSGTLSVADIDEWWETVTSGRLGDRLRAAGDARATVVRSEAYRRAERFARRTATGWDFPSAAIIAVGQS